MTDQTGFSVQSDGELLILLTDMAKMKHEYEKIGAALEEVKATGYGIVVPTIEELVLDEPEIVKQGGRYGVQLKAPQKIWESNIFGRSFHELINEDLSGKLKRIPDEARMKLQTTLERIINEGSGGLICIIL